MASRVHDARFLAEDVRRVWKRNIAARGSSRPPQEFRKGLQKAGFTGGGSFANHKHGLDRDAIAVSVEDTVRLFNYFDSNKSGTLSYAEFVQLLQNSVPVNYTNTCIVGEDTDVTVSGGYGG